ncbi:MAG: PQQ-binding-like beta-propeller repeat protein [Gemmataceae bacterium]
MRRLAALIAAAAALVPAAAQAQPPRTTNVLTQPRIPAREDLNRLNLRLAYAITLPMEGKKDAIATVQLEGDQLIAQLRSGLVAVYDAETGAIRWSAHPGQAYPPIVPIVAVDDRYVIVTRDVRMFAFNRALGHLEWVYELPSVPSAPPASDGERLYVTVSGNQLTTFLLPSRGEKARREDDLFADVKKRELRYLDKPKTEVPPPVAAAVRPTTQPAVPAGAATNQVAPSLSVVESVTPPFRLNSNTNQRAMSLSVVPSVTPPYRLNSEVQSTPDITVLQKITRLEELSQKNQPPEAISKYWLMSLNFRVSQPAVPLFRRVLVAGTGPELIASHYQKAMETFAFTASGNISAPLGRYGDTVYVPTADANLYAIDFEGDRARTLWTYSTDSGVNDKPVVAGPDLYLTTVQGQLYRLSRDDGVSAWKDALGNDRFTPEVQRFLAANTRFIYATDVAGNLVVISRERGNRLSQLPLPGYTFAVENDLTDRVYLAANNGTLICLHDRDVARPIRYAKAPPPAAVEGAPPPPPADAVKPKQPAPKAPADKPAAKPADKAADKPADDKPKDEKPKEDKPKEAAPAPKKGG